MINRQRVRIVICALTLYLLSTEAYGQYEDGPAVTSTSNANSVDAASDEAVAPVKKKRKKRRRKKRRAKQNVRMTQSAPSQSSNDGTKFGVGIGGGYAAPYGNHVSLHLLPIRYLDLHAGAGYNTSGPKIGAGADVLLPFTSSFGLSVGGFYSYSAGGTGEVPLEATFTDSSGKAEPITATKAFSVNAAQLAGASTGFYLDVRDSIRFQLLGHYSAVVSGNEVSFDDEIKFDKPYSITNQEQFDSEFQEKAESIVAAGGLGASLGIQFFF